MHVLVLSKSAAIDSIDVQALLTAHGFKVTSLAAFEQALEVCAATGPDIVILDWESAPTDAQAFCRQVRKAPCGAHVALIALIRDDARAIEAALAADVNDYMTRPLKIAGLAMRIAIVERWLHARQREHAPTRAPLVAASYADFLALLDASPDPAGIHRDRVFLYANQALAQALGYESLVGVHLRDILHPDEHASVEQRLRRIETTGEPAPARKERFIRRDGGIEIGEAHSFLVELPDGLAVVTSGTDVTRAEQQEAHLRHSERLAAVGRLAASVAHEINNPMTLVLFNLWDLSRLVPTLSSRMSGGLSAQLEERLKAIETAVTQMQSLTKELTAYAREEEPSPSPVDVAELMGRAVRMMSAYARGVAKAGIEMSASPGARVIASETRLTQVLLNLLLNAVDAVAKASPTSARRIETRVMTEGAEVVVQVRDSGPGVPSDVRARMFEPFFSTKPAGQGTGLGLAVSQRIVADMGGTLRLLDLDVENSEEQFTTFELRLPLQSTQGPPQNN